MASAYAWQSSEAGAQGAPQPVKDGSSVFRLLTKLRRSALSKNYFARPQRSIDRQAQEWWLYHD
jgi:hypothetical protein